MTETHPALDALQQMAKGVDGFGGEATLVWACQRAREARGAIPQLEALLDERKRLVDAVRELIELVDPEEFTTREEREAMHDTLDTYGELLKELGA